DLVVYIPEAAVIPEWILKQYNFWNEKENKGIFAGQKGNRVKSIKLRGELSTGIILPTQIEFISKKNYIKNNLNNEVLFCDEGDDVAEFLGITKYEPPIPVHMAGEIFNAGSHLTIHYDIENFKSFPDILQEGEEVVITEKLHGSWCGIIIVPEKDGTSDMFNGRILVCSKGLGAQGLCFKANEQNETNVYIRVLKHLNIFDKLLHLFNDTTVPIFVLGEVYGPGVQDLSYGNELSFRIFDIGAGYRGSQIYWDHELMTNTANLLGIQTVPLIYKGSFSKKKMLELTSGKETVSGKNLHMREGIVIKPIKERNDEKLGRVILKSVSAEYLTRKGGTEYN
ncbi:MAG: RNA ligase (ATP), partial [Candidatus Woesearchaeota archaeon]